MNEYKISIFLNSGSGKPGESTGMTMFDSEEGFKISFNDIRDYVKVTDIEKIILFKNGVEQKECPPIWVNHKGYIFSSKGLERVEPWDPKKISAMDADYFVNEECDKLDEMTSCLDMDKVSEFMKRNKVKSFEIPLDGAQDNFLFRLLSKK